MQDEARGWLRRLRRFSERLWVRIGLIAGLSLVAALGAAVVGPLVPDAVGGLIASNATEGLLDSLASSMLSVTIFSLTVMVSIHRAISGDWTPRAHRLLSRDRTTMSVLATFVGAWLFSLVAMILLAAGWIIEGGRAPLFLVTLVVIGLIVVAIVRWIGHLETFGSLEHTLGRLEAETKRMLEARMRRPCLGGRPLTGGGEAIPPGARPVRSQVTGWICGIDPGELHALCEARGTELYLWSPVGRFVHEGDVLAYVASPDPTLPDAVRGSIEIGVLRGFAQDPRFGFVAMGEVASKALSSGINDPGTAIDVIGRCARVLTGWRDEVAGAAGEPRYPCLHVPPLDPRDLLEDAYAPIARDGAGTVEVQIHLQQALRALARHDEPRMAAAAGAMAEQSYAAAREALGAGDRTRLERAVPREARRSAA